MLAYRHKLSESTNQTRASDNLFNYCVKTYPGFKHVDTGIMSQCTTYDSDAQSYVPSLKRPWKGPRPMLSCSIFLISAVIQLLLVLTCQKRASNH